jgi:hypothetical protein
MAERNVVYQRNRRSLNIPQVDYANAKAVAAGNSMLNQSINRLTAFMESQAEITAQIEGAEYGAANSPTLEQIETSLLTGEDLELPGNKRGSVFERAARNATMEILHDELTFKARSEIIAASIKGKENNLTPVEMREKFDAIMSGYAATLDIEEPKFAKRLRAQIGIFSNAEYKSYTNDYVKKVKEQKRSHVLASVQMSFEDVLPRIVETGVSVQYGNERGMPSTKELIAKEKVNIMLRLQKVDFTASKVEQILNEFDKKVDEYAYDIIESHILSANDEIMAIKMVGEIMRGEMPESVATAFDLLGPEKIQDARKLANETLDMYRKSAEDLVKIKEANREALVTDFENSIAKAAILRTNNFEAGNLLFIEVLADYEKLLPPEVAEYRAKMPRIGARIVPESSDAEVKNVILQDLFSNRPKFTIKTIIDNYNKGQLSQPDYADFLEKYRLRFNENYSRALKLGRASFDLNESFIIINPESDNAKRVNKFNQFEREMMAAREEDPTEFDAYKWAEQNLPRFLNEHSVEEIESAKAIIDRNSMWTETELSAAMNGNGKVISRDGEKLTRDLATKILDAQKLLKDNK